MSKSRSPSAVPAVDDAWGWAVHLLAKWEEADTRVDWLLEELPAAMSAGVRGRVQMLVLGTLRQLGRIEAVLAEHINRAPRAWVRAALRVAGFEIISAAAGSGDEAKVVHHLVEQVRRRASGGEAKFANAVARHLARALSGSVESPTDTAPAVAWAWYYSHPEWLIERWWEQLGREETRRLLELHQEPAEVTVRWRGTGERPEWLVPVSDAPGFYDVPKGKWGALKPALAAGEAQVSDAETRHAVDLLALAGGERVLDLCAAPGGKSIAIADRLGAGEVVSVDLPGRRQVRLRENLQRFPATVKSSVVPANILRGLGRALAAARLPVTFDAVLIDAPCSNTGVIRHRVDVRWRLDAETIGRHARQQLHLLLAAAEVVAPGGRLVYSTCSIDREENEQLVEAFLQRLSGSFTLEEQVLSRPWETGRDGAAAFRLRRSRDG